MTSWTRCWLAALFVGCSPLVVGWIESFVDFDFFHHDFHFLDYQQHPKRSPQRVRNFKKRSLNRAVLTHPDQLAIHNLKTTTTGEGRRVTRLTCNSGVNFRNRYECWSQWSIQCIQQWPQFLHVWIRTSWKCIHHRMSVSNGWVLSLKIQFFLSIRASRTSTRLSSRFYPAFRPLKRRKMSE